VKREASFAQHALLKAIVEIQQCRMALRVKSAVKRTHTISKKEISKKACIILNQKIENQMLKE
jgi:hypothetical protein